MHLARTLKAEKKEPRPLASPPSFIPPATTLPESGAEVCVYETNASKRLREAREYYGKLSVHGRTEVTGAEIPPSEEFAALSDLNSENDTERLLLELETTDESAFWDAQDSGAEGTLVAAEAEYEGEELENSVQVEENLQPEEQVALEADIGADETE
jgi:hypothetical protein